jgi:hypothetical protein
MDRRRFLSLSLAVSLAATLSAAAPAPRLRTRWKTRLSEGFDAICFLGALSGRALYTEHYQAEADAFGPKLDAAARADIKALWDESAKPAGLFGPYLTLLFSRGRDTAMADLVEGAGNPQSLRANFAASPQWDEEAWLWFASIAPRLRTIFEAMRDAGFASYRRTLLGSAAASRPAEIAAALRPYDVVAWQEKLTGRRFDPVIEVVLLYFSKPHGIKVQGQTFLQALDYPLDTTVRIAAHEMLHPPIDMKGAPALAAIAALERDPLIPGIVSGHNPAFGYTSLEGYFNEDLVQALDQIISEALGVAKPPAERWRDSDAGMHVLAAGLYGLLKEDRWDRTGGDISRWIARAARNGRLSPELLHPAAAKVLDRPVDRLWPLPAA